MNSFEKRQWQIKESPFHPSDQPHMETILTIGNGYLGIRGTLEEGYPGDQSTTLIAGVFNHKEGTLVPDLVSMPNPLCLRLTINGERFQMNEGRVLGFERVLDLQNGILRRGVLWLSPKGTILRLAFERFASLDNQHVLATRILIQALSEGEHEITVTSCLDGTILNPGNIDHWATLAGKAENDRLTISGTTNQSGYVVGIQSALLFEGENAHTWSYDIEESRTPTHHMSFSLSENEQVYVTKLVAIHSSRESENPLAAAVNTLEQAQATGYESLKQAHLQAWADYWRHMDILIEGDEVAQRAVRFCTYHILIAVPQHDPGVSIGAKTLSGFGYKGHVFWDTELFMLPPLTLSFPEHARRLLMYRYHNLAGARAKAEKAGYAGAMFPWESTDTGEETTPQWTDPHPVTGERIRIWTGDNEQHISTDIAYATLQFWQWSRDDDWFAQYGAEMVLDTAKFWGSRAEYNAKQDRYELSLQIGPDEYHENVDNSVFTNRMVVWHLEQAAEVWKWLQANRPTDAARLSESLKIDADTLTKWQDITAKMWINVTDDGVFEQFEGFFERLQPFNLADYTPRVTNMDWILGHERTQRSRVIKQADIVMLMALLGNQLGDKEFFRRNWDTYIPIVDHGSSLSPSIHAWVASHLGLMDEAYDLFIYAATIDLEDHKGNVRDGIHAASCGGVWQAVVFGFCGLTLTEDGLTVKPNLPSHWRRVRFNVQVGGQTHTIDIDATA